MAYSVFNSGVSVNTKGLTNKTAALPPLPTVTVNTKGLTNNTANLTPIQGLGGAVASGAYKLTNAGSGGLQSQAAQAATGGYSAPAPVIPTVVKPITQTSLTTTQTPVTLPSAPVASNTGNMVQANNVGLASLMTDAGYKLDSNGQFVYTPPETIKTQEGITADKTRADNFRALLGLTPKKESVYKDQSIINQQAEVENQRRIVNDYTSQLNSVIAKQNQDLLQLRQTGSQEGVTEAVYGGQALTINREAAIKALPLQAAVASAQGNLSLAQEHLDTLIKMKSEDIQNEYDYKKMQYDAISNFVTKEEQRQLDALNKANDRAYQEKQDLITVQGKLLQSAVSQKAPASVVNAINSAKTQQQAIVAAGVYGTSPDSQIVQLDNGQTVVVDKRTGKIVANIGGQKTVSTANIAGLTPEQANDPFIKKLLASAGGKPLTDTFAQQLNKGLIVLGQIGALQANIKDVNTGPIVGAFKGANPWDTNAQTIKAQLNAIVPNLARGVYGEVGVLTDNDIKTYSQTLPNLRSTEDIRNAVLGITVDIIGKSIKRNLEINAANGKDVSGFIDIYTEMQNTKDGIFSQIPGYKGSTSKQMIDYTKTLDSIFNQ